MLMEMTGQTQLSGAAFFSFLPNNEVLSPYEDCSGAVCAMTTPSRFIAGPTMLPHFYPSPVGMAPCSAPTLGLGAGTLPPPSPRWARRFPLEGWVNSARNVAAAVSNESASATTVNFTLEGIEASGCNFTVYAYLADTGSNTAVDPVATYTNQCITDETLTLNGVAIPAYAVLGIYH